MEGLSFRDVCNILAAKVNSIEMKSFFASQAHKASDKVVAVQMSTEDFVNQLDKVASVADALPLVVRRSYMQGVVMHDGTIWNPLIHRRTIPFTVLNRMFTMHSQSQRNEQDDYSSFNAYVQMTWPVVLSRRLRFNVLESDLSNREKLFDVIRGLTLKNVNNVLQCWYEANRDGVVGFSSVRYYIKHLCHPKSMDKTYSWIDSEKTAINMLKESIYSYNMGDRYYVSGIRYNGTVTIEQVFKHAEDVPIEYLVYLYVLEGLWGTIVGLYSNQEYLNRYFPAFDGAKELYDKYRNSARFNKCVSKLDLIEICMSMYNDLYMYVDSSVKEYHHKYRNAVAHFPYTESCTIPMGDEAPAVSNAFSAFNNTMDYIQWGTRNPRNHNRNYVINIDAVLENKFRASEMGFDGRFIAKDSGSIDYHCFEQLPFVLRKQLNGRYGIFNRSAYNKSVEDKMYDRVSRYYQDYDFNTDFCTNLPQVKPVEEPCRGFVALRLDDLLEPMDETVEPDIPEEFKDDPEAIAIIREGYFETLKKCNQERERSNELWKEACNESAIASKYCEAFKRLGQCPGYLSKCILKGSDVVTMHRMGTLKQYGHENEESVDISGVHLESESEAKNVQSKSEYNTGCGSCGGSCGGTCGSCGGSRKGACRGSCKDDHTSECSYTSDCSCDSTRRHDSSKCEPRSGLIATTLSEEAPRVPLRKCDTEYKYMSWKDSKANPTRKHRKCSRHEKSRFGVVYVARRKRDIR